MEDRQFPGLTCVLFCCFLLITAACSSQHYIQVVDETIVLYYQNSEAEEVLFASSLDRFRLHRASRLKGDMWEVVVPKKGEFSYFYIVNDSVILPDCEARVLDDFGAKNCFYLPNM